MSQMAAEVSRCCPNPQRLVVPEGMVPSLQVAPRTVAVNEDAMRRGEVPVRR
ncbi:MAG: hypothetical protein K0S88_709 [Actinomycetia bacterium]|jgi:hypothetical protein|nr:hypothetical protein [Actinomycetes bacterium]